MTNNNDKFMGVMFGGAVGDALGSACEFLRPGTFEHVTELQGGKKFKTNPGERTDDTSMTLCLAQSLIDCKGFDIEDQLDKYCKRLYEGYMSSNGKAFDIGVQTVNQLFKYSSYKDGRLKDKIREIDISGKRKDGNGALMRVAPVAIYHYNDINKAIYYGGESAKSTHHTDICIDTCRYFVGLLIGAINGVGKGVLLSPNYSPIPNYRVDNIMHPELQKIIDGSYKDIDKSKLAVDFGYILDSLQVALRGFYNFDSFEEGMINVVNLGYDSDTNGCIYGFLAGAYYGYDNIPDRWKNNIAKIDLIKEITTNLSK